MMVKRMLNISPKLNYAFKVSLNLINFPAESNCLKASKILQKLSDFPGDKILSGHSISKAILTLAPLNSLDERKMPSKLPFGSLKRTGKFPNII